MLMTKTNHVISKPIYHYVEHASYSLHAAPTWRSTEIIDRSSWTSSDVSWGLNPWSKDTVTTISNVVGSVHKVMKATTSGIFGESLESRNQQRCDHVCLPSENTVIRGHWLLRNGDAPVSFSPHKFEPPSTTHALCGRRTSSVVPKFNGPTQKKNMSPYRTLHSFMCLAALKTPKIYCLVVGVWDRL